MTKEPSVRAKKYVRGVLDGKSKYQAATAAGYSPNTAIAPGKNIEKPSVLTYMQQLMEQEGLTDKAIIDVIKEGIWANKVISAQIIAGNQKDATSMTKDFIDVPDHPARAKFVDIALKLKDSYPTGKLDITTKGQPLGVTIDTKPNEI